MIYTHGLLGLQILPCISTATFHITASINRICSFHLTPYCMLKIPLVAEKVVDLTVVEGWIETDRYFSLFVQTAILPYITRQLI